MSAPATIVIGTGVDELVCAHRLAVAGQRVTVLEQHAALDMFEPGWVPPAIASELALAQYGFAMDHADPWAAAALDGGGRLELCRDMDRTIEAIRRVSPKDAASWPAFCARMAQCARLLELLYAAPPPAPVSREPRELLRLAATGLRAHRIGGAAIAEFLRLIPMPVADLLDEWFESDALKAVLGAAGVMHLAQGPRSGGTAFVFLHHHAGGAPGVFRPPRSNARAALMARPGIEIRRAAAVAQIRVRDGRVAGVVLAGGEEIAADRVVSGVGPRCTLTALVDPGWLDPELVRAARHVRARGVSARVVLTGERAPDFSVLTVAPSLDYLERAYDDAKYRRVSRAPWLEARSAGTDGGRHRVDVHVQYVPYAPGDGAWNDAKATALGERVRALIAPHARSFADSITGCEVLAPCDLERRQGYPQGQPYHAELALDQALWMRPVPAIAHYRTPVAGLYLCGPGTHPGGGIAGWAGMHAARALLEDIR